MAVRYRKGRASPWQCYWNNPLTGKRECANFATQLEAEKHDSLIKHRIKFERESFQGEEKEEKESAELTLEVCYLQYLKQKQFNRDSLGTQLTAMRYPLQRLGDMPVQDITKQHLEQVAKEVLAMPIRATTARTRLGILRAVLRWCAEQKYRGPVDFPKMPRARCRKFIPPTPDELESIFAHAAPHIVRVAIIGAQLGARVGPSELLQLTWADIDLNRRTMRIHGSRKNPDAPWREVPIKEALVPVFEAWKHEDETKGMEYLIHYHGKRVASDIWKGWHNACRRAGITRNIRPYDLRHAFGTELVAGGCDVGTVASLMGHSNPTMLLTHYQYVLDRQKRAAVESLPDVSHVSNVHVPKSAVGANHLKQ